MEILKPMEFIKGTSNTKYLVIAKSEKYQVSIRPGIVIHKHKGKPAVFAAFRLRVVPKIENHSKEDAEKETGLTLYARKEGHYSVIGGLMAFYMPASPAQMLEYVDDAFNMNNLAEQISQKFEHMKVKLTANQLAMYFQETYRSQLLGPIGGLPESKQVIFHFPEKTN